MLKKLRNKKTSKKILIGLAIVIIPAFAFWGFSSVMHGPKEPLYAGTILGKQITYSDYKDAMSAVKNTALMMYGDKLPEMQQYLDFKGQAWDRLILLAEANKRKLTVRDDEVINLVTSYPIFQRKGQFDKKLYSQYVQYVFQTQERAFEEQVRQNLILNRLYKQVTSDITPDNEAQIRKQYLKYNEEIAVEYIASLPVEFAKNFPASEEELKNYYSQNSLEFKLPITFNVEYISSDSEEKIKNLAIGLNKSGIFSLFEKFSKRQNESDKFIRSAKKLSFEVKETGFFNQNESIPGIGWAPDIMNIITNLKTGEYSPIIGMDKRYLLLRLKEKKEPYIPDFNQIKSKVKEAFISKKTQDFAIEKIDACLKALENAKKSNPKTQDFAKIAKEMGLKYSVTQMFKYGSYIEGIGPSDMLWEKAAGLKDGEYSGVIDMGVRGLYIVKLKEKTPIDEKKFTAEKNDFSQKLLEQKKAESFSKFTEELKRKARMY